MINYKITDKIISSIENIRSIWWVIENASIVPEWEQKLRKIARLRSWVFSTRIEWSKITLEEASDLIEWKDILARPRDKKELENYLKVLDYIETKENEKKITHKDIFTIHKLTTKNILSSGLQNKYREQQNAVYDTSWWIVYMPPEFLDVSKYMDELLNFINTKKDISPLIRAWLLHHFFVIIHPFIDWNGRTSRALTQLFLYQNWFNTKKYFSLEEYYDTDLNNYYKAINIWTDFYTILEKWIDSTSFLEYFLKGIEVELYNLKKQILDIKQDELFENKFKELGLTNRQLHILLYTKENSKTQMKDYLEKFNFWRTTLKNELALLVKKWILQKNWLWKWVYYNLTK
jgi:Fic family protein